LTKQDSALYKHLLHRTKTNKNSLVVSFHRQSAD